MRNRLWIAMVAVLFAANATAELEVYKDYDLGESVFSMTTVKVDANMADVYLAGLKQTWVESNNIAKDLGHIEDFHIYASDLPQSGEFNLVLTIEYKSGADLEPSKKRYQAFMKKWGEKRQEESSEISKSYPNVRTITGQYRMREIIMK
ncbi:MAG: hypothetical protein ACR2PZ_07530 [Pseudomonadales bacterium]